MCLSRTVTRSTSIGPPRRSAALPFTTPAIERVYFCLEKSMTTSDKDRDILARTLWGER